MLPTADSAFAHDYESDDLSGFSIFPLVVIIVNVPNSAAHFFKP